jgi:hypothetical protein
MALRNAGTTLQTTTASTPAAGTPAFEGMEDTTTTTETTETASEVVEAKPASTETAVQVVAPSKNELLAVRPMLDKNTMLRGLRDAIPTEELAPMGIGVFPRITASQGGFVVNKNEKKLGGRIRVEVLSWNYIHMVVTGEQNNTEANKLIRSSYDGKYLRDGGAKIGDGSVATYIEYLKSQDYEKANVKQYIELYVNLIAYEETNEKRQIVAVDVPADEQKIYQVSLSPQSVGQWGKYLLEGSLRKARGHNDDSVVTLVQCEKTVGPNTFAFAEFEPKW